MDARRGAFFVIEGTDGAGKATQFALLKERLEVEGYPVVTFDFPQYEQPSSYFIQQYLRGGYGSAGSVGPYAGSLFYALDRYDVSAQIKDAIDKGYVVLANRFTGSNMAHQGAKFSNPSERRGYYIWLDSLEFMVLGIPRPDINFVLRVPAKVAHALAIERAAQNSPGKALDLHEAGQKHAETSVRVYDELSQLFPKDFRQIDCVRGGTLMSIEKIQQMLWETVLPHLPPVPIEKLPKLTTPTSNNTDQNNDNSSLPTATARMTYFTASQIGLSSYRTPGLITKGKPYYIPATIKGDLRGRYTEVMDSLFELHSEMLHRIPKEHASYIQSVLPLAAYQTYDVPETYYDRISELHSPEARVVRAAIKIEENKERSVFTRGNTIARMASDMLPASYAKTATENMKLVSVNPRNELEIIPYILYPSSELSLADIQSSTATWQYDQKSTIFLAYLATGRDTSCAVASISYIWDVVTPFTTVQDIQSLVDSTDLTWQTLTPRLGYEVPEVIEESGLVDLYERSFDTSLELYSELQAAGFHQEAQYAVLCGNNVRCLWQVDGWKVRTMKSSGADLHQGTRQFIDDIQQQAAQVHPLLMSNV